MNGKVGIGIIGTGFARKVQIPAFLKCENAKIVSVASAHFANAESAAKDFDIAHYTADWRETVAHEAVDLVCITTPPDTHFTMALAAIENGKHILCEKPMALSAGEAREMHDKSQAKNRLALIDHELRFLKGRQKAFEMIRRGEIGKIRHAKSNFRAPHRGDAATPWNWWSDIKSGGGALGAIGSHSIDSLCWFLDAEITQVFCQLQTHVKRRQDSAGETREVTTDDEANLLVRFAGNDLNEDATGTIAISMVEYPKYQNRVEFFGTRGAIRIDARGEIFLAKTGENDWTSVETDLGESIKTVPDTGFSRGFVNFAPKIIEAILSGAAAIEHAATFADGWRVQRVLDAAHESNRTGAIVKI